MRLRIGLGIIRSLACLAVAALLTGEGVRGEAWCSQGAVSAFDVASLAQSRPEPNALNTISVTLRSTAAMGKSSAIIISGLSGAILPAGEVKLEDAFGGPGTIGPSIFCSFPVDHERKPDWVDVRRASWDTERHMMMMYVCPGAAIECGGEIRLAFTVQNADSPQAAPDIYVEAHSADGESLVGRTRMDGPSGHSILLGVPHGLKALHIEDTFIPHGVEIVSPGDASLSDGSTELWLRPGWYKGSACNLLFARSVTIRGTSSDANDIILDCEGRHRHMRFTGHSTVGAISNVSE
jgi:hypothetical protein